MKITLKVVLSALILIGAISLLLFGLFFYSAEVEFVELKIDPHFKETHWTPDLKQQFLSHMNN